MAPYLVGSDVGTGGAKSALVDARGRVVASAYREYGLHAWEDRVEQDPDDYWRGVAETIRECLERSGVSPADVAGVAVSGQSPACILVDRSLRPLRPAHIWMDRRGSGEADAVRRQLGEEAVFALSANPVDPYYGVIKLLWERHHEPEIYARAVKMLNQKDYVVACLTGRALTDVSNAALDGIAFDIRKRRFDPTVVSELGLDMDKLPEVFPCDEVVGAVTEAAARLTGLSAGTPVVAGTVDANAAWLSMGVIDDGDNCLTMGTAACWGVAHKSDRFARGMIALPHAAYSRERYFTAAAMVSGGALLRWYRDGFADAEREAARRSGVDAYDLLTEQAARVPPGADGLVVLPYFMGERNPIWDTEARGVIFGLSIAHGKAHVVRALMEAVGYGIRHNIDLVRREGIAVHDPLYLVEGGANSPLWRQIMADIVHMPVEYLAGMEGAPLGDAVVAGVGTGVFPDYEVIRGWRVDAGERRTPRAEVTARYDQLFAIYLGLYPSLKPWFRPLQQALQAGRKGGDG